MPEAQTLALDFVADDSRVGFRLQRLEVLASIGRDVFQPTVGAAVDVYLEEHQVDWTP